MTNTATKLLYSELNPSGPFLEDILQNIVKDLEIKTDNISEDTCLASINYRASNEQIIALLEEAISIQKSALEFSTNNS